MSKDYSSIIVYLHAYLASHAEWSKDRESKERARIVLIGLATLLANGPKEYAKKKITGDLVFNFLRTLARREDWTTPGVAINPEDFLITAVNNDDPIFQKVQTIGFPEVHRRSVEILELWGQRQKVPSGDGHNNTSGRQEGGEQLEAQLGEGSGVGAGTESGAVASSDTWGAMAPRETWGAVAGSQTWGAAAGGTDSGAVAGRQTWGAVAGGTDSGAVAGAMPPFAGGDMAMMKPYKYCRGCRRALKKPMSQLQCAPPGSEKACFECNRLKMKCTNRRANLKFPDDPERDTDNERDADLDAVLATAPGSGTKTVNATVTAQVNPPTLILPETMPPAAKRGRSSKAQQLTVPERPQRKARSVSPAPRKVSKAATTDRVTRSRSTTPMPPAPRPPTAAPPPPVASASTRKGSKARALLPQTPCLAPAERGQLFALRSDVRGLTGGYSNVRGDVASLTLLVKLNETTIAALNEGHKAEVAELRAALESQRSEFQAALELQRAELEELKQILKGSQTLSANLFSSHFPTCQPSGSQKPFQPASVPVPTMTRTPSSPPSVSVRDGSGVAMSVGPLPARAPSAPPSASGPAAPASMAISQVPYRVVAAAAVQNTFNLDHSSNLYSVPPRSATPSDSSSSALTDLDDMEESSTASGPVSNKRKAGKSAVSGKAKKSKRGSDLSLKPPGTRGRGQATTRGRGAPVSPARRSGRLNKDEPRTALA
ncbi:hypothetical protein BKA70DRAFT_1225753 [Coprinopsis sp. MPI-PUGE-AT-0042]|nr:hypothetical protein BKA70DRAFT_1225753 [Coprinopsis sp. MPI-PUGE-AT-0042]